MNTNARLQQARQMLALGRRLGRDFSADVMYMVTKSEELAATRPPQGRAAVGRLSDADVRNAIVAEVALRSPHWRLNNEEVVAEFAPDALRQLPLP